MISQIFRKAASRAFFQQMCPFASTPKVLLDIQARARKLNKTIILPETFETRNIEAKALIEQNQIANVMWVENPQEDPRYNEAAQYIYQRRKAKGVTEEQAAKMAAHHLFFGASMVGLGYADGCVAGAHNTTGDVLRAALACIGPNPKTPVISSFFMMVKGDQILTYADGSVIPNPTAEQLAVIAETTGQNHKILTGQEPRIAFLSFSTFGSAQHKDVEKVRKAVELFKKKNPNVMADGEFQFDAAYVPSVQKFKAPKSPLKGQAANIYIFPTLDAGNIGYKITQRLGGFEAIGPVVQGLNKPMCDLSRGCNASDIMNVVAICSLQAANQKKK